MSNQAFLNDPTVKTAALTRATSSEHTGWAVEDSDEQRLECSNRFGLSPALLNLFTHGFHIPYGQEALAKLHRALEAIQPGADTLALVRNWALALWDSPSSVMRLRLEGTAAVAPAKQVVDLLRASADGEVPRESLRRARNALNATMGDDDDLNAAIEFAASLAWDLEKSPRSTTDIWNAWEASVMRPLNRSAGWSQSVQDELLNAVRDAHTVVYTKLGPPPSDPAVLQQFHSEGQKLVNEELLRTGHLARFADFKAYAEGTMLPAMNAWRSIAEQSVFDACAAAR